MVLIISSQDRRSLFDVINHAIIRRTILMEKYFIQISSAIFDNLQKVNLCQALSSFWGPYSTLNSTPTPVPSDVTLSPPSTLLQSIQYIQTLQTPCPPPILSSSSDTNSVTGSVGDEERSDGSNTDEDIFSMDDFPCKSPLLIDDADADVKSPDRIPPNTHCIIVDWDDTLMATTQLTMFIRQQNTKSGEEPNKFNPYNNTEFTHVYQEALSLLEIRIITFLTILQQLGDVYIITNSEQGWVQMSCKQYLPSVWDHISTIPIISARTTYECMYPNNFYMYKLMAFQSCIQPHHKILMSFGDNPIDHKAAADTGALKNIRVKNIKFAMFPDITLLNAQLGLIVSFLPKIYEHTADFSVIPMITTHTTPPTLKFSIVE
jgi:hypothetical protein